MSSIVVRSKDEIMHWLTFIPDPEIPVVNIVEMGMIAGAHVTPSGYEVLLSPTYTGCPAMGIIEAEIKAALENRGISPVTVKLVYEPAWTTDMMSEAAKDKLRKYGIAPPLHSSCASENFHHNDIPCPRCGSVHTVLLSRFGATACKALYKCSDCKEPFEYFKCH